MEPTLKKCDRCKEIKELSLFYRDCTKKDKKSNACKKCCSIQAKKYRENNQNKIKEIRKNYYKKNKKEILKRNNIYYTENKSGVNKIRQKYKKSRFNNDIQFKLSILLRDRLNKALKGNYKIGSAIKDLGCSIVEFKLYIESKFQEGMTWNNHGEWHIDHIRPLSSFNLADKDQLLQACHFTNLQPLWAEDNLKKGPRFEA